MADAVTFYSEEGGVETCGSMAKVRGLVLVGGDTAPEQKKLNCGKRMPTGYRQSVDELATAAGLARRTVGVAAAFPGREGAKGAMAA